MRVQVPVSVGELVDKVTILAIKCERMSGVKREHAEREYKALAPIMRACGFTQDSPLYRKLYTINNSLWCVEDDIRGLMRDGDTHKAEFLDLAMNVPRMNDTRAAIKAEINAQVGSEYVEVKSYEKY